MRSFIRLRLGRLSVVLDRHLVLGSWVICSSEGAFGCNADRQNRLPRRSSLRSERVNDKTVVIFAIGLDDVPERDDWLLPGSTFGAGPICRCILKLI